MPRVGESFEYRELVPVFHGPLSEATILRGALAARGLETLISNEVIKSLHPFVTGANALDVELVAPESDAESVRSEIEKLRGGEFCLEGESDSEPLHRSDALGRRVRWSVCCVATIPVGAVLGFHYLSSFTDSDTRPRYHRLNVLASIYAIAVSLASLVALLGSGLSH